MKVQAQVSVVDSEASCACMGIGRDIFLASSSDIIERNLLLLTVV